ncbi:MAG: folate-binding protein [Pacificimonas sp.]|jgi:folate-binding protein YgfZ|nr:folate-binding protein [Pacificimonas sp.]
MIVHLSDRAVIRVHGEDARAFLNGILTNDVALVAEGAPSWSALLTAQGKLIADMIVWQGGTGGDGQEEVLLDLHRDRMEPALTALRRYRLRRPLDIDPVEQRVFAAWDEPLVVAADDPRVPALGKRWLAATAAVTGTLADYEARRITLGVPDSPDFEPEKLMWLESSADRLNGVSFTKGCFVGQENTARMNYRGKVRKRVLPVKLSGDPGGERDLKTGDGKAAGTLRTLAETPDGWRGMAHLRLEHADGPLAIGEYRAEVAWPDWLPRANADDSATAEEETA